MNLRNKCGDDYYILCGRKEFKQQLINADIRTDKDCLIIVPFYSKLGEDIRKLYDKNKSQGAK